MLNDVFSVRYAEQPFFYGGGDVPQQLINLFRQARSIIAEDLVVKLQLTDEFFLEIHNRVARELAKSRLGPEVNAMGRVLARLDESFDVWNDHHHSPDVFVKERLSIIEMTFRHAEEVFVKRQSDPSLKATETAFIARSATGVFEAITELNARFRNAKLPFHYHGGLIQFTTDDPLHAQVEAPTWVLVSQPPWKNVEHELQAARDHADNARHRDAARNASNALESTIKIISEQRNWTRGTEQGAANFIDNLVSEKNGRFIDPWEAELLKSFFRHVRNNVGHGSGPAPMNTLTAEQSGLIMDTVMAWIKALITRY